MREERKGNKEAEVYQEGREGGEEQTERKDMRVGVARKGHQK